MNRSLRPIALATSLLATALLAPDFFGSGQAVRPAAAQAAGSFGADAGDKPVEILADEGIEWQQNAKAYIARGNAKATRGDTTVSADTLTAYYRDTASGGTEIFRVVADGNVHIESPQGNVQGDRGVYEVDRAVFVMTGKDVRLTSGTDVVTARDSLEYWEQRELAVARGAATATREDKRIRADTLTATLGQDQKGDRAVRRVDAFGNVLVSTTTETARAETGVYNLERGIATLRGKVKITRGKNQLNGEYAVVDLNSGISRMLPAPAANGQRGRVTGLFVPNKEGENGPAAPPPPVSVPAAGQPGNGPPATDRPAADAATEVPASPTTEKPVLPRRKPNGRPARERP